MQITFFIAALIAVFSTIMVITRLNAVHALLYLIVSLLSVAVIFFILGAPFIAALEVIVYAGAIMVLFIFVIMMLNLGAAASRQESAWLTPGIWIGPGILVVILLSEIIYILANSRHSQLGVEVFGPKEVGISLFGPYLLGVEMAAMLLLAGIIGAFHLSKRKKQVLHRFLKEVSE